MHILHVAGAIAVLASALTADPLPDRLTYTSARPGNWDIYLFEGAGHTPRRLTDHPALDYDPVVSPDGRWLVFCSERRGNPDLYVLDLKQPGEPRLLIDAETMEDEAAFSSDGKFIAFVSTASGNADIYLIPFQPDRTLSMSHAKQLTRHPRGDLRPTFSPDDRKLAFSSERDSAINQLSSIGRIRDGDVYLLDLLTLAINRLTDSPGWDGSPAWSQNGKTIYFYSQRDTTSAMRLTRPTLQGWGIPEARIWAMNSDGTNQRVLTPNETLALSPEVLPDGRIAYSRKTTEGLWQIVSVNANGTEPTIESDQSTNSYWKPARVPGASTIVVHGSAIPGIPLGQPMNFRATFSEGPLLTTGAPFRMNFPDRKIDIYPMRTFSGALHPFKDLFLQLSRDRSVVVLPLHGSSPRSLLQLENHRNPSADLAWSADGRWIAFAKGDASWQPQNAVDVWKVRADGTEAQNLTPDSAANDGQPSFSPDGKRIVFRSGRSGSFDLYWMNADGTNVKRLTDDSANDLFPVCSPRGNQIAFVSNRHDPASKVYEIYLLQLNGDHTPGRVRRLTYNDSQEGHIAFSPDGRWLIYSSEQAGINDEEPLVQSVIFGGQMYGEMFALRLTDGFTVRLTHNKWEEGVPSWVGAVR